MKFVKLQDVILSCESGTWGNEASVNGSANPVLRSANINNFKLTLDECAWREIPVKDLERKKLQNGDIIITSSSGSPDLIGKCAYFSQPKDNYDYYFSNFTLRLRSNEKIIFPKLLFYWLISDQARSYLKGANDTTSGLRNLNKKIYLKQPVPHPPLPEQKRIVEVLDKADALREKRRLALQKLDTLLHSVFLEMFGDPVKNPKGWKVFDLGDVCKFTSGSSLPEGDSFRGQAEGLLLVKVSDMNLIGNETFLTYSKLWKADFKNGICPKNSIVIPKRGGAIFTNKKRLLTRPAILDPNMMAVIPNELKIKPLYLFWWFQKFDLGSITSGSSVPQLNKQDLSPLAIAVPPIELQNEFHLATQRYFGTKHKMQISLERANNLFQSLQQRAFKGELFSDEPLTVKSKGEKVWRQTSLS